MKQRTRIYYSEEQKTEMWDRWQKVESLHAIDRLFDRYHSSLFGIIILFLIRTVTHLSLLVLNVLRYKPIKDHATQLF